MIPYFDRHVYVIALFGVLFFYGLHTDPGDRIEAKFLACDYGRYLLFNFFVGASLSTARIPTYSL